MNTRRIRLSVIGLISTVFLLLIDQYTKRLACTTLMVNGPKELIRGVFRLEYLENTGAAWGLLDGARGIFVVIAVLLTVLLGAVYLNMPDTKRYCMMRVIIVLIVSGALGNMIDRIRTGYVVDFFFFYLINFPIFNVADCYVVIGAVWLALLILFYYKDDELSSMLPGRKHSREDHHDAE